MTLPLSKEQLDALKSALSQYGLEVRQARKPKALKPKASNSVGEVLARSKWYKRPSRARCKADDMFSAVTESFSFRAGTYYGDQGTVIRGNERTSYAYLI